MNSVHQLQLTSHVLAWELPVTCCNVLKNVQNFQYDHSSTKWRFRRISPSSLLSNHTITNLNLISLGDKNPNFFVLSTYVYMYTGAASSIQWPAHEFLRGMNIYVKNHSAKVLYSSCEECAGMWEKTCQLFEWSLSERLEHGGTIS